MFEAVQKETVFQGNTASSTSNNVYRFTSKRNNQLNHHHAELSLPVEYFEQTQFSDRCRPGAYANRTR
ncbi:hypothetical protein [Agarivorans albus]|uniref:Uncharacterized protein n=1 Tax=Agarivorans albus MKT 106 TaxID=1331007 RepID=R9PR80_AGAAL|nr:hypothetical protein [Agarivorans albus]GAD03788.1 hypothetical protein AALB_3868 [Agarivorans albus MKT 106]